MIETEIREEESSGCKSSGSCATAGCDKLNVHDWLADMQPAAGKAFPFIEVKFKNTRKDFYKTDRDISTQSGDIVVVQGVSGYDIGRVSLTGILVRAQMRRKKCSMDAKDYKKVLRKPSPEELKTWEDAKCLEKPTMLKAREISHDLKLQMKISDVEYQADKSKATFYYTAEERVDFRELIRVLADRFKVRIEMRQIGARQEAGRLGGIGSCGRELCCSSWMTDFRSVSTGAARYQQLAINPLKLAGQCGKLKCCLNFELDSYLDALKDFPSTEIKLQTKKGRAYHFKSDIFKGLLWYAYINEPSKVVTLSTSRVKEIIEMNKAGNSPDALEDYQAIDLAAESRIEFENVVGQDSLNRFDHKRKKKKKSSRKTQNKRRSGGGNQPEAKSGNKPGNKRRNSRQRNRRKNDGGNSNQRK